MRRTVLIAVVCLGTILAGSLAYAQRSSEADAIALARREAQAALERSKQLEQESRTATDEAARARAESSALAARIEASEADLTAAEAQVRLVERMRREQRARLAESQEPVARLMAALQTMGRRPPALALVQPGSLDNMIRVRALLASTLPVVRQRSMALRNELQIGERLREQADRAVMALRLSREELRTRRVELARFEADQRRRSQSLAASALFQSDRALALTEEARDLSAETGTRQFQAWLRHELGGLPGPVIRPTKSGEAEAPALPYRLPVKGELLAGTGEISAAGVHARGLTFRTRGNEPVLAPAKGTIAYAGPFRTYGSIVIIDHGRGWTSVVTNIARLEVATGSKVRRGDRLGRTGAGQADLSVELRRNGAPVPITPLLSSG